MEPSTPNAEAIAVWNEILVPKFVRFRSVLVDGLGSHGSAALDRFAIAPGERILDVGCGFGDTTIELAKRTGPAGSALGIDCCEAFLDYGRKDARAAGITNASFAVADAQTETFPPEFDLCFSRFGTMFFQSPVAAMRNLSGALKPGGRLLIVVWRTIDDNDWLGLSKRIAQKHLPPPPEDGRNCGPGPFSMADRETVTEILERAGFSEPEFSRIDRDVWIGRDAKDAVEFEMALGPAGEIVREAGELAEKKRPLIEADLLEMLGRYAGPNGVVMPSSSWAITARRPG